MSVRARRGVRASRVLARASRAPLGGMFGRVTCGAIAGDDDASRPPRFTRLLTSRTTRPSRRPPAPSPTTPTATTATRSLRLREKALRPSARRDVLVRFLASPVNPADVNTVEGTATQALRHVFPAVGGRDGVGVVRQAGANVDARARSARVPAIQLEGGSIPDRPGLGTWREWAVPSTPVTAKAPGVPIETAARAHREPTHGVAALPSTGPFDAADRCPRP